MLMKAPTRKKRAHDPAGTASNGSWNIQKESRWECSWGQLFGQKHSHPISIFCDAHSLLLWKEIEEQTPTPVDRTLGIGTSSCFLWGYPKKERDSITCPHRNERGLAGFRWRAYSTSPTGCFRERCIQRLGGRNRPFMLGGSGIPWLVRYQPWKYEKNEGGNGCNTSMEIWTSPCAAFAIGPYKPDFFRIDIFHTLHKGVFGDIAANAVDLWLLVI